MAKHSGARSSGPHSSLLDQTRWPLSPSPCPPSSARPSRFVASHALARNSCHRRWSERRQHHRVFTGGRAKKRAASAARKRRAARIASGRRERRHATGARARSSLAILAARESGEAARRSQTARAARDVIAVPASLIRGWLGLFPTFADAREGLAAPGARAPSRRATPASSSEFDHTRAHRIRRPAPRPRARSPRRTSR